METKKSFRADLERRKSLFFNLGLVLALSATLFAFEWKKTEGEVKTTLIDFEEPGIELPPSTPPQKEQPKANTAIMTTAVFNIINGETNIDFTDIIEIDVPDDYQFSTIGPEVEKNVIDITDEVKILVDFDAEFPGGHDALTKFISENIRYPQDEYKMGMEGTVYLTFVVEKNGEVSNVNILRSLNVNFDNEAIKMVKSMPKWKPASDHGKLARQKFTMPIKFVLR